MPTTGCGEPSGRRRGWIPRPARRRGPPGQLSPRLERRRGPPAAAVSSTGASSATAGAVLSSTGASSATPTQFVSSTGGVVGDPRAVVSSTGAASSGTRGPVVSSTGASSATTARRAGLLDRLVGDRFRAERWALDGCVGDGSGRRGLRRRPLGARRAPGVDGRLLLAGGGGRGRARFLAVRAGRSGRNGLGIGAPAGTSMPNSAATWGSSGPRRRTVAVSSSLRWLRRGGRRRQACAPARRPRPRARPTTGRVRRPAATRRLVTSPRRRASAGGNGHAGLGRHRRQAQGAHDTSDVDAPPRRPPTTGAAPPPAS